VLTGAVQEVAGDGFEAEASPDGRQIVYVDGTSREIRVAGVQGDSPRTIFRTVDGEIVASVHWLPGGNRIGYLRGKDGEAAAAIETRDVSGGDPRHVMDTTSESIAFTADAHVLYTEKDRDTGQSVSLWMAALERQTGAAAGAPAKLAVWQGVVSTGGLTASADGRRVAFTKTFSQADVHVLALQGDGALRRLTTDTLIDWPTGWSLDGSSFFFVSNRNGRLQAFRQGTAEETPEPLAAGDGHVRSPQVTADGKWIVYLELATKPGTARVMRMPSGGGPAEQVLALASSVATSTVGYWAAAPGAAGTGARSMPDIRCPRLASSCVVAEMRTDAAGKNRVVLSAFDPAGGRPHEVAELAAAIPGLTFWDVSPDGSMVASGEFDWGGGDRITVERLGKGEKRTIQLRDFKNVSDIAWAADGRSLFATANTVRGGQLLRVSLDGSARLLRTFESLNLANPRPSPDGRSLLVGVVEANSNAWIIER